MCENSAGYDHHRVCLAEWGFSAYIETNGANILFDTGQTEVYRHNARGLGIDLEKIDFVVLSHRHGDHTGGIRFHNFKSKKKLILHPELMGSLPEAVSKKIAGDFEVISVTTPLEFSNGVYFLGEIPRINDFEKGEFNGDKMLDDSALAIRSRNGAIVISGCSHSGIVNTCEYAKRMTGQALYAVVGGFHLFEDDDKAVSGAIEYFKKERPKFIYPMHCVDFPTLAKFHSIFGIKKLSAGDSVGFDI